MELDVNTAVLEAAKDILNGQRKEDYGNYKENFYRVTHYWNTYLGHKGILSGSILPEDVAMLMILFKISRLEHNYTKDSAIDICGYITLYDNLVK